MQLESGRNGISAWPDSKANVLSCVMWPSRVGHVESVLGRWGARLLWGTGGKAERKRWLPRLCSHEGSVGPARVSCVGWDGAESPEPMWGSQAWGRTIMESLDEFQALLVRQLVSKKGVQK